MLHTATLSERFRDLSFIISMPQFNTVKKLKRSGYRLHPLLEVTLVPEWGISVGH